MILGEGADQSAQVDEMAAGEEDIDQLMSHLGEFGKYQLFQLILLLLSGLTAGLHNMSIITISAIPNHRCLVPWAENETDLHWDTPSALSAIPVKDDGSLSSCQLIDPVTNVTKDCNKWVYDKTYFEYPRTVEWDLVCDKEWLGALSKSIFILGVFFGSFSLGYLADKYGRKRVFCCTATMQLIVGIGIAFVKDYYLYLVISFFYGLFGGVGSYLPAFVIVLELVGPTMRTPCGVLFPAICAIGIMLDAAWAYIISDYFILQIIYGAHSFLIIGHWWLIDESPRWLWAQGRIKESVNIVAKAVRINGGPKIDRAYYISKGKTKSTVEPSQTAGFLDIFKTPRLRMRVINFAFNWFANGFAYYGLSLATDNMSGNPFFIIFALAVVELPSYFIVIMIMDRTGRRSLTSTFMLIGSLSLLLTTIIPKDMSNVTAAAACIGKFCISGSFAIIYNYNAELLPTVIRNAGIGFSSACSRVSAMLCPVILLLNSVDKRLPMLVFGSTTFVSGFLTLFLPETLNKPMPQSMEDGENFGIGDTAFSNLCDSRKRSDDYEQPKPI